MKRIILRTLALLGLAGLLACSNSGEPAADAGSLKLQDAPWPQPLSLPLGLGCGWTLISDADTVNVAFPDSAATYWVALLPLTAQTRVRIDGRFPAARYSSYNSYDALLRALDVLTDVAITPLRAGENPLRNPAALPGARYTAYLQYGAPPATRASNVLYGGELAAGPLQLPNNLVPLLYRVYLPDAAYGADGGVGLPQLTIESADGARELARLPDCATPPLPTLGGLLPAPGLNALLLGIDYPDSLPLPFPTAVYPPRIARFYGLPDSLLAILGNLIPLPLQNLGAALPLSDGGFLSNLDNAYVTSGFSRRYGQLMLMRLKAPAWRGMSGVPPGQEQLRYWSICQNEFLTQRYTACVADQQTHPDAQGYVTVAVSDAADRPANASAAQHIDWLPWGPFVDGLLIYRHMLPAADFAQAIQHIDKGESVATVMADYQPQLSYCRPAIFAATAGDAAAIFDACVADQLAHPPADLP